MTYRKSSDRCIPPGFVQVIDDHIIMEKQNDKPPLHIFSPYTDEEKATILLTLDLERQVQLRNWENVQRLVDTVPEATKIPVIRRKYSSHAPTLVHFAISQQADPITLQGIIRVMDMDKVNRGTDGNKRSTLLHWCVGRYFSDDGNARSEVLAIVRELLRTSYDLLYDKGSEGRTPLKCLEFVSRRIGLITFLRQTVFALDPQRHQHKTRNGELVLHAAFTQRSFPYYS